MYLCKHDAAESNVSCQWHDNKAATTCQKLEYPAANITFLGPDLGGQCVFYSTDGCIAGTEVVVADGKGEK